MLCVENRDFEFIKSYVGQWSCENARGILRLLNEIPPDGVVRIPDNAVRYLKLVLISRGSSRALKLAYSMELNPNGIKLKVMPKGNIVNLRDVPSNAHKKKMGNPTWEEESYTGERGRESRGTNRKRVARITG